MFVRPQHFQQAERYADDLLGTRLAGLEPFAWGFTALEIAEELLPLGKIGIHRAAGVAPDGTAFSLPVEGIAAPVLEITPGTVDQKVYLALPLRRDGGVEVESHDVAAPKARFQVIERSLQDLTDGQVEPAPIQLGVPNLRLLAQQEGLDDFAAMPIARIQEVGADGTVKLDDSFLPPSLDCQGSAALMRLVTEVEGMLRARAEALSGRLDPTARTGDLVDFLMLASVNRYQPLLADFSRSKGLHPRTLFRTLLSLAGEIASFDPDTRRPPSFPAYDHADLNACLPPVMAVLRKVLGGMLEQAAVNLPLEPKGYGVHVAPVADKSLVEEADFVLAVAADVQPDQIRQQFPNQIKIGPVEEIRDLVNLQLPGIGVSPLPVAPRAIPYRSGFTYFALDHNAASWAKLQNSAALAVHVSGQYPELAMELWAVRQRRS